MASTWSLVAAVMATVLPAAVSPSHSLAIRSTMVVERAGDDPVVGLVGVERARVAGSQLQGGGRLPPLGEAVEAGQLVHPAGGSTAR